MSPLHTPTPELVQRVTHIEQMYKVDALVRRIAILDAKLDQIDDLLRTHRNSA